MIMVTAGLLGLLGLVLAGLLLVVGAELRPAASLPGTGALRRP